MLHVSLSVSAYYLLFWLHIIKSKYCLCSQLARKLDEELDSWLRAAGLHKSPDVRAVIAP
jgi:hypothetical protein